ncbi:MAG: GHMP kinase [Terriglobia bacterium]
MRLHAYAPTRIDLAGGTLDIWPLYLFHPGALTLNLAITRYAHCVLEGQRDGRIVLISRDGTRREKFPSLAALVRRRRYRLPLLAHLVAAFAPRGGLSVTTWSEAPSGSGLGGSSALGIALCAALAQWGGAGVRIGRAEWIPLVRDVEARILSVPTGEQDHYPALYGGVSAIHLEPRRTRREALHVDLAALESRLLLAYTGKPRRSGVNNWEVFKRHLEGNRSVRGSFRALTATAVAMRDALVEEDWRTFGRLLAREWHHRRRNAPAISTPFIDRLVRIARCNGAQAGKVCGAGGGGCVVFFTAAERRTQVAKALVGAGATLLPFQIARSGVRVERLR